MASNYPTDFTVILSFGKPYDKTIYWVDQNGTKISLVGKEVIWTVETPKGKVVKYPPTVDIASGSINLSLSAAEIDTLFPFFTSEPSESPYSATTPPGTTLTLGEFGQRFTVGSVGGWVTGCRFYRPAGDTVTSRTFNLWNSAGQKVSSVTSSGESGSGWREYTFPTYLYVAPGDYFTVSPTATAWQGPFLTPDPRLVTEHISDSQSFYTLTPGVYPTTPYTIWFGCDCIFEPVPENQSSIFFWGSHKLVVRDVNGEGRVIRGNVFMDSSLPEDSITFGESVDVQVFATAGSFSWNKPPSAIATFVTLVGGGGGGGSGRRGAAGTIRGGGDGGTGGAVTKHFFRASDLGSSETVVVGAGGAGGIAVGVDNTAGNAGTRGGNTTFGANKLIAYGGPGGGGGVNGAGAITDRSIGSVGGVRGAAMGTSPSYIDGVFSFTSQTGGASGGAGGGYIDAANVVQAAGSGLAHWNGVQAGAAAGVSGGAGPGNGESNGFTPGGGGGGGASTAGVAGQTGGNGGTYGGGGGGGAGCTNPFTSGAGGNGANGLVVVFTFLSTS